MDLAAIGTKLREDFNPNNPLESLYMRLNEWVDYATTAGETTTEVQVMHIAYGLVVETGQFQED